ncbi:MAG TPA: class I SAM-dependent methyltransferase [Sphingomicrobium sp.]|nr:class I SAM-dependent methyltransferase [Sphingomicrobium sp.]
MSGSDTVFAGSIPATYQRYMVPLIFGPYAELAAERARALRPSRILETAAGTGVLTEELHRVFPHAEILATDLNQPMLDEAAGRRLSNVTFVQADALHLPFEDASFDLVACQFGAMFFPDKVKAHAEAHRLLRDGGTYLLLIWDGIERNLATRIAGRAVADLFPENSAAFYERVPFRYSDTARIEEDLRAAGFARIQIETVELRSRAASARDAAIALTQGTPMRSEIEKGGNGALSAATEAAEAALRQFEGAAGFDAPMSAHVVTVTK